MRRLRFFDEWDENGPRDMWTAVLAVLGIAVTVTVVVNLVTPPFPTLPW